MIYFAGKVQTSIALWKSVIRVLAPVVLPILALAFQKIFWDHIHSQKFLFFYPAVMVSGWIAGKRSALLATIFSASAVFFLLMDSNRLTITLSHDEYIPLVVFVAIGMLISHYLNVEERVITQLALQTKELEEANQARISFLAHVSHEIRTPLNAILGYAQLLEQESHTASQRAMTQRIESAGEYLLSILNNILDFKKIEANLLKLAPHPVDLFELLNEIQLTVSPSAHAKGIIFELECAETQGLVLFIDSLRLRQILLNLCTNAIKFTERGHVTLRARVLEDRMEEVLVLFEVQDTGIGISDEGLKLLFTPFMQADDTIAGRFGGSGLGLSIVKQLVEMMRGSVGVQSRHGHGSLFWLELPLERASPGDQKFADKKTIHDKEEVRLHGLKVLAADDNPINLDLVARLIQREGGVIEKVTNGNEVLEVMKADPNRFDVILMDLHMPFMDGIEATRTIRSTPEWCNTPVIAYSAESPEMTKEDDVIALFDGWIEKPIRIENAVELLSPYACNPEGIIRSHSFKYVDESTSSESEIQQPNVFLPAVIDPKRVSILFGNDLVAFYDCFSQFQRVFASSGRELDEAIRSRRDVLAKDLLHNVRGAAANLGLSQLAEAAKNTEMMLMNPGNQTTLDESVAGFIKALKEVLDVPHGQLRALPTVDDKKDRLLDEENLAAFSLLLAESDLKALSIMPSLQNHLRHDLGEITLRELNYALEGLEFEKALKILANTYGQKLSNRRDTSESAETIE